MRFLFFFHANIFPVFPYFYNRLLIQFFCLASNHLSWRMLFSESSDCISSHTEDVPLGCDIYKTNNQWIYGENNPERKDELVSVFNKMFDTELHLN